MTARGARAAAPCCPLCAGVDTTPAASVHGRDYFECPRCGLTFLDPTQRLEPSAEVERYRQHRNDPADAGYRAFLARLADPLLERLPAGAEGLDYGSGPGPTLSLMLTAAGHPTTNYDPFFAPDETALRRQWDFVTCTETAEHFFEPGREFERLDGLLRPGGWLGLMTTLRLDEHAFGEWWYVRDPTHVCFYRPRTLEWIAGRHGWSLERPGPNVALFRKRDGARHGRCPSIGTSRIRTEEAIMADEGRGKAEHVGGKVKEKAGELLGDRELEREGRLHQEKGRAEQDEARAQEQADAARRRKLEAEAQKDRTDRKGA